MKRVTVIDTCTEMQCYIAISPYKNKILLVWKHHVTSVPVGVYDTVSPEYIEDLFYRENNTTHIDGTELALFTYCLDHAFTDEADIPDTIDVETIRLSLYASQSLH